ncbi:MAG TPA: glycosyltransferase family 2 protein [Nitrospiria bacterium]
MEKERLFSVITVCKDDLKNLKRTYHDLQAQTFPDLEWIVIDGESKDGTVAFLEDLNLSNAIWESSPDLGLYDAMNKGISKAQGEFLIFLNAGDCFASEETLIRLKERVRNASDFDLIYGDAIIVFENGEELFEKARGPSYFRYGQPIYHQAILYRRESIGSIRFQFEKFKIAADYAFALELIAQGREALHIPVPVCRFFLGGISSKNTFQILKEVWIAQRDILHVSLGTRLMSYMIHLGSMISKERVPWLFRGLHRLYQKCNPV